MFLFLDIFLIQIFFFLKFLVLLFRFTEVTTEHQKLPEIGQNSIISPFYQERQKKVLTKGQSPPKELEVGPCSGPYLLLVYKNTDK